MLKKVLLFFLLATIISCQEGLVFSEFRSLENGSWDKERTLQFSYPNQDTISPQNLYINVRNNNDYRYSNLFLITEWESPLGEVNVDTLEYEMALANGEWLGKGMGDVKESRLWFKENLVLDHTGDYKFTVRHAMRANGEENGINKLEGILDVGLQVDMVK